jgi:hypothetical protein
LEQALGCFGLNEGIDKADVRCFALQVVKHQIFNAAIHKIPARVLHPQLQRLRVVLHKDEVQVFRRGPVSVHGYAIVIMGFLSLPP